MLKQDPHIDTLIEHKGHQSPVEQIVPGLQSTNCPVQTGVAATGGREKKTPDSHQHLPPPNNHSGAHRDREHRAAHDRPVGHTTSDPEMTQVTMGAQRTNRQADYRFYTSPPQCVAEMSGNHSNQM